MAARDEFLALLKEHGITQAAAAAMICALTQRPCSVRAVRSWVNDPAKPSSRPCPDWAVAALARALSASPGTERN
ncbi:hypothetical protein CV044_12985 [Achromobacter ruhlandii]|nr:hypothetical protein CV044_12985 [Achromobacter ruhlandii]